MDPYSARLKIYEDTFLYLDTSKDTSIRRTALIIQLSAEWKTPCITFLQTQTLSSFGNAYKTKKNAFSINYITSFSL